MTRRPSAVVGAIVDAIRARPAGSHLLVLLDLDAALCDATDPDRPAPHRRALVARLANAPQVSVAIGGTRPVADLRGRVGLGEPVVYVGQRGLEISGHGIEFVHQVAVESNGLLGRLTRSLEALTNELPGVRLEHHGLSVTLDVRDATPEAVDRAEETLDRVAATHFENDLLRAYRGPTTIEVRPAVAWDDAHALRMLCEQLGHGESRTVWPLCAVDDIRGASLFRLLREDGVCVAVGDRPTHAAHRLPGPNDVDVLLRRVLDEVGG